MKKILALVTSAVLISSLFVTSPVAAKIKDHDFKVDNFGKYSTDLQGVTEFFKSHQDKFGVENAQDEFSTKSNKKDNLGYTHIKLQQTVKGTPVFGHEYIVHFNDKGEVYSVNGNYNAKAKEFKKSGNYITPGEAENKALSSVNYDPSSLDSDFPSNGKAKLYLYKLNNEFIPVYLVQLNYLLPEPGNWNIFVNAYTGEIVNKYNKAANVAATGSGKGVLGDTKTLNLDLVSSRKGSSYNLTDLTRGAVISTYTSNYGSRIPGTLISSSSTTINDPAAVDAHYYAGVVYDYYKEKFNRNSINGAGMAIKSSVHYLRNYVNAGWTGTQMVYGDGNGVDSLALSGGLDVIAHEITHGVDQYEADLVYQDQPGALNESMSDAFGVFVEYYAQNSKFDWLMGEDIWTPGIQNDALRDISDPTKYGDPAHMNNYVNTTQDYGGVHTNSGIPNKACYLITNNLGVAKAEQIYYRALTVYMTAYTDFSDARACLAQAAADLYGSSSAEVTAVHNAFSSVGVN
jgi:bacillolysin